MSGFIGTIFNLHQLEEMATKNTSIHRLHPLVKILVTMGYAITVISFGKYEIGGLMPFVVYPIAIFAQAEIPFLPIFKRVLVAMPFILFIGMFNPFLDRNPQLVVLGVGIWGGWISFGSLVIKGMLTILAALLLIAISGIGQIAMGLRLMFVPHVFVLQLLLLYRYITVLIDEAFRVSVAYQMRGAQQKGLRFDVWGSLLGQLLLRTYDRAIRIYQAMTLRGF
jgi:cobalt/nickel transport system permease protein